ncbi:ABC transporter ATP-binding protein [Desulfovibrionales bacterium]
MDIPPIIALDQVSFAYAGGPTILDQASFSMTETQHIGLYGPNGSGKSTLFHLLTGLIHPVSGQVYFRGQAVCTEKDFWPVRRDIGLVLQNAEDQLFHPTVLDDVAFGPLNLGLDPAQARERAMQTLHELGLEGFENRITHRLSGGEKKLVSLATILSMHPKVLLLDEPTNGLDPQTRKRITEIVAALPTARIIISHDWDFLARTSSQYLTVRQGKLISDPPLQPHAHTHAHPLGNDSHRHA